MEAYIIVLSIAVILLFGFGYAIYDSLSKRITVIKDDYYKVTSLIARDAKSSLKRVFALEKYFYLHSFGSIEGNDFSYTQIKPYEEIKNKIWFNQYNSQIDDIVKQKCDDYLAKRIDDINKDNPNIILINKEDAITPTYLKELFPYLSDEGCKNFTDYCYSKTIYDRECLGDGKRLLKQFIDERFK